MLRVVVSSQSGLRAMADGKGGESLACLPNQLFLNQGDGTLSAIERGLKEPGATVPLAISQFGESVNWLLTGEMPPPNKKRR